MTPYQTGFRRWMEEQSALLRAGEFERLDTDHPVEELESMGALDRRELINRLVVLLAHLLKWRYQPERRSTGWRLPINEQRRQIALILDDSPGLKGHMDDFIARAYRDVARAALDRPGF